MLKVYKELTTKKFYLYFNIIVQVVFVQMRDKE